VASGNATTWNPSANSVVSALAVSGSTLEVGGNFTSLDLAPQAGFAAFPLTQQALTVSRAGSGSGSVTSSPSGIDCGSTCRASFNEGTSVSLTAVPAAGSTFTGWSGGGCAGTGACQVTMSADQTVTATFTHKVQCIVPKVKGKKLRAAKRAIWKGQCRVGRITRAHSGKVRKGRVISQRLRHGRHMTKGYRVRLVDSRGRRLR
jgi:Divergent InlB B-repeat domain